MIKAWNRLVRGEEGASLVEYTLLLVLIAVVAIAAVSSLGTTVNTQMNNVSDKIDGT
ncbi:MAG: Flp family type IVb pilin [Pirellulaceae bacterium]|jgi:pilus assembly protein Flp/PilA